MEKVKDTLEKISGTEYKVQIQSRKIDWYQNNDALEVCYHNVQKNVSEKALRFKVNKQNLKHIVQLLVYSLYLPMTT